MAGIQGFSQKLPGNLGYSVAYLEVFLQTGTPLKNFYHVQNGCRNKTCDQP